MKLLQVCCCLEAVEIDQKISEELPMRVLGQENPPEAVDWIRVHRVPWMRRLPLQSLALELVKIVKDKKMLKRLES